MCTLALVLWRGGGREGGVCFSNLVFQVVFDVQNTKTTPVDNNNALFLRIVKTHTRTHTQHIRETSSTAFIINLDWYRGRPI